MTSSLIALLVLTGVLLGFGAGLWAGSRVWRSFLLAESAAHAAREENALAWLEEHAEGGETPLRISPAWLEKSLVEAATLAQHGAPADALQALCNVETAVRLLAYAKAVALTGVVNSRGGRA